MSEQTPPLYEGTANDDDLDIALGSTSDQPGTPLDDCLPQ